MSIILVSCTVRFDNYVKGVIYRPVWKLLSSDFQKYRPKVFRCKQTDKKTGKDRLHQAQLNIQVICKQEYRVQIINYNSRKCLPPWGKFQPTWTLQNDRDVLRPISTPGSCNRYGTFSFASRKYISSREQEIYFENKRKRTIPYRAGVDIGLYILLWLHRRWKQINSGPATLLALTFNVWFMESLSYRIGYPDFGQELYYYVRTKRCFNVYTTSITLRRRINVKCNSGTEHVFPTSTYNSTLSVISASNK